MYISKPDNKVKIGKLNVYQQLDNKIKHRTNKYISAELTVRSRSDYQMYFSKADDQIKIRLSNVYQQI